MTIDFRAVAIDPSAHASDGSAWLTNTLSHWGGRYPSLDQIWGLMDETWEALGCDTAQMDQRICAFYAHPVWLLNGLFIEQHPESLAHRREFARWIAGHSPRRVADFGGGYGTLARMIGSLCSGTEVEVIEPHPHPAAIERSAATANVRYRLALTGEYDILIATDVFEHVPDPLALVEQTAHHLRVGGYYLIANCFWPVIRCHLPQTFHFRYTWDSALAALGLIPRDTVSYGRAFERRGELRLAPARVRERRSRKLFPWVQRLPGPVRRRLVPLLYAPGL